MTLSFRKMHGLGNDFVVLDGRAGALGLDAAAVRAIADRRTGVGCDQLIIIEAPTSVGADAFMRIHNADGGEVGACGNATRCIAALLMAETGRTETVIETRAGRLFGRWTADGQVAVDMGRPRLDWREIPLAAACDTLALGIGQGPLQNPVGVNMGNPHAVFFVPDAEAIALAELGPPLEHHPLFPERANIGVCQVLDPGRLRLRVWERGAGITRACGTGACAAMVAAVRRGFALPEATVLLDGGALTIRWRPGESVLMAGPVAESFTGRLGPGPWSRPAHAPDLR